MVQVLKNSSKENAYAREHPKELRFKITCFIAIFVGAAWASAMAENNNGPRIDIDGKKGTMAIYTTDQTAYNGSKII